MLASLCSKSFQLGFSSTWTENFQMYKLGFKEAEKPEIKLPTFVGSWRKQGSSKKTSTYASLTMLKTLTMWISTNCGKFLEMGVPDHLTYVLRNCMWVKKQLDMEQLTGSKLGKEYNEAVYYHPALFNLHAEYTMQNAELDESQAGITITGRNINSLIFRWYYSNGRKGRTKEPLEGERGEWKSGLKLNIQKTKIMVSSPITSWQIDGGKMETVTETMFLGSKITVDGDCSHESKKHLLHV